MVYRQEGLKMTSYGVYKCEFCHAEFRTLEDKFKHVKKFHSKESKALCNFSKNFRQPCLWEFEDFNKV